MAIDKYVVNSQITTHGDTADITLQVTASGISTADAKSAEDEFNKFIGVLSGKSTPKKRTGAQSAWTDKEREVIKKATSSRESVVLYRAAFPKSTRRESGITRMWLYLKDRGVVVPASPKKSGSPSQGPKKKPQSCAKVRKTAKKIPPSGRNNALSPRWSEEEKSVVDTAKDAATAWAEYQVHFPTGPRNENAVYQRWTKHHKAAPAEKSAPAEPAPGPAKESVPPQPSEDQDPAEPEKTPAPQGTDQDLIDAMPDTRPPTGPEKKTPPRPTIIGLGTTVRHNGPKSSPFFGKTGTVSKMGTGSQILVNFGESSQWLSTSAVIAVPGVAG